MKKGHDLNARIWFILVIGDWLVGLTKIICIAVYSIIIIVKWSTNICIALYTVISTVFVFGKTNLLNKYTWVTVPIDSSDS